MYSHVVYTSMTLLNCPSITDTSGETAPVRHRNSNCNDTVSQYIVHYSNIQLLDVYSCAS